MVVRFWVLEGRIRGSSGSGRLASLMRASALRAFRCGFFRRRDGRGVRCISGPRRFAWGEGAAWDSDKRGEIGVCTPCTLLDGFNSVGNAEDLRSWATTGLRLVASPQVSLYRSRVDKLIIKFIAYAISLSKHRVNRRW